MITKQYRNIFTAVAIFATMTPGIASAADTQPGDFIPAPPGTQGFLLYGFYSHYDDATFSESTIPATLESYVIMPRYVYFYDIAGMTADINVLVPIGKLAHASVGGVPLHGTEGFGDLTVAGTLWLVNDPKANRYLALAGYLNFPTGSYVAGNDLNLGSNRYSGTLQLGSIYGLNDKWFLEFVVDATAYADNDDVDGKGATLSQDPTYTFQSWVNYQAFEKVRLSLGYAAYWGGEQTVNGLANGITSEKQQVRAAITYSIAPTVQVLAQVNHDFDVTGGLHQNTSGLIRLMNLF